MVEQEHQIRNFLLARTGVLNLMLHSTYDHDLMSQLAIQSQQMAAQRKAEEVDSEVREETVS